MCIYVFIQVIYLIAFNISLGISVCVYVCEYFQVGMNVCSFSIPDLCMCYSRMNHWLQPDKRWVDINQYNWIHTELRGQRSL